MIMAYFNKEIIERVQKIKENAPNIASSCWTFFSLPENIL